MSRTSTYIVSALAAALLFVFIVVPLGAVFFKSVHIDGALDGRTMRAVTVDALDRLGGAERSALMEKWIASLDKVKRMETTAAALGAIGVDVTWDRKAEYVYQIAQAKKAVAALNSTQRDAYETEYPVQAVVLHKRIPLAFKLRKTLSKDEFERLRTGARKGFSLSNYTTFLTDTHLLRAFRNSLIVSTLTSLITVILAYALAFGINRNGIRAPGAVRSLVLLPLVSPPIIMAFAAILLFGRQGLVTKKLLDDGLGLINADVTNLYGFAGVVTAMVLSYLPHAYIVLDDVLARHDGRVEEAAASQGATAWQVFRFVTVPLTRPGIVRAAMVVFILSMTDFGNPLVIGRNYPVLAGVVYNEIVGFQNVSLAAALCIWLIVPTLLAYFAFERFGQKGRFVSASGTGAAPELELPRAARLGLETVAGCVCVVVVAFFGIIIVGSFTRVWGIDFTPTLTHYSINSELYASFSDSMGIPTIWTSLKIAGAAAVFGGVFAVLVAYVVERTEIPGRNLIGLVALLPGIVPGVLHGVGYLVAFNSPLGFREFSLVGTPYILVLNVLFANIFVGVLAARATLQRVDTSIDEAAEVLGANMIQTFFMVTLPTIRRVLLLASLYVFVHGMVTLSAVIFLVSPDHMMASVGIFLHAENGRYGLACSMSVIILGLVVAVMAIIRLLESGGQARTVLRQVMQRG